MASPTVASVIADQADESGDVIGLNVFANFDDDDVEFLTYSVSGLPVGTALSIDPLSGILSGTPNAADIAAEPITVTIRATDKGGEWIEDSFTLSEVLPSTYNPPFPRINTTRIGGSKAHVEDNATGAGERANMALFDSVSVNLFDGGPWGDPGYLTRAEFLTDMVARNATIIVTQYTNVMETPTSGEPNTKLLAESGPLGADVYWGAGNNDWYAHLPNGDHKSTFAGLDNINITDWVQADADGNYYPQWYAAWLQSNILDDFLLNGNSVGVGGINIFIDVMDTRARTSTIDWDGDGVAEDAQDAWDPENATHQLDPDGLEAAAKWRQAQRDFADLVASNNPGILITVNLSTWPNAWGGAGANPNKVQIEYRLAGGGDFDSFVNGGVAESLSNNIGFPASGLDAEGADRTDNSWGNMQLALNQYWYDIDVCAPPKMATFQWVVETLASSSTSPEGSPVWPNEPHASADLEFCRMCLALGLMDDGFVNLRAIQQGTSKSGNVQTSMLLDEFGTVNAGTTGLTKGWLGYPTESAQRTPLHDNLHRRFFDNGAALANVDYDNSVTVTVGAGLDLESGVYKFIDGVQDSSANHGGTITANFSIPAKGGQLLEKV